MVQLTGWGRSHVDIKNFYNMTISGPLDVYLCSSLLLLGSKYLSDIGVVLKSSRWILNASRMNSRW